MPKSSVQRCVERERKRRQKLSAAMATGEPGDVVAAVTDDELTCDDVEHADDVARLNTLELYRLLFHTADLRVDLRAAAVSAWHALPRQATTYPIVDDDVPMSWRERCDRAMADDSGTDDGDW